MKISELEILKVIRRKFKDKKSGAEREGVAARCMDSAAESPFGTFVDVGLTPDDEKKFAAQLVKPGGKMISVKASRVTFPYAGAPMTVMGEILEIK